MVGRQLKGHGRLFLAQILANQAATHQILGCLKGIEFLVIDRFDINGRKSLLLTGALYQLQCQRQLTCRIDLEQEGRVGVFLLVAHVASVIGAILQRCGVKCQIQIQRAVAHVDLRDLSVVVGIAVDRPGDAILRALVGQQCVLDRAVIFLHLGACLDQLRLEALAIMRNDVASRFLVKADDPLVSAEQLALVIVVALLCLSVRLVCFIRLVNVIDLGLVRVVLVLLRLRKGGNALAVGARHGILDLHHLLHTELSAKLHQFGDRLQDLLGRGAVFLAHVVGGRGRVGLLDDLTVGLGNMLFDHGDLTCGICRAVYGDGVGRCLCRADGFLTRNQRNGSFLGGSLSDLLDGGFDGLLLCCHRFLLCALLFHRLLCGNLNKNLVKRLCHGDPLLFKRLVLGECYLLDSLLNRLLCGLSRRRQGVSFCTKDDDQKRENKCSHRGSARKCQQNDLRCHRHSAEQQCRACKALQLRLLAVELGLFKRLPDRLARLILRHCIGLLAVPLALLLRFLQLALHPIAARVKQLVDQDADPRNLGTKQARQYNDRDQASVLKAQVDCQRKKVLKVQSLVPRSVDFRQHFLVFPKFGQMTLFYKYILSQTEKRINIFIKILYIFLYLSVAKSHKKPPIFAFVCKNRGLPHFFVTVRG